MGKTSYDEALARVIKIRMQRQKIYGDDWKQQADWELLALLKMKVKRLEHFIIDGEDEKIYERKIDANIDLVNYALFLLQNLLDKESEELVVENRGKRRG